MALFTQKTDPAVLDRITALESALESTTEQLNQLQSLADTLEEHKKQLEAAHQEKILQLEKKAEELESQTQEKIDTAAAAIVADLGMDPVESTPETTPADIQETYNSLTGKERAEFYQRHKTEFLARATTI